MAGKQYAAKLPPDLEERIEEYLENASDDTSQADAIRHYIRHGIEHKHHQPDTEGDGTKFLMTTGTNILSGAIIVGVAGIATGLLPATKLAIGAGILALIGTLAVSIATTGRLLPRLPRGASREH